MARGNGASQRRILDVLEHTDLQSVEQINHKGLGKVWRRLFPKSQSRNDRFQLSEEGITRAF